MSPGACHDAEGEMTNSGDARTEPDVGSVNIEKVAQLAKLCATGTPSDKDFKVIKERAGAAGNEVADENEWRTAEKAASSELPRDPNTGHDAFFQQIEMARDKSDFSAGLKAMESSIRLFPRRSSMRGRTSSAPTSRCSRSWGSRRTSSSARTSVISRSRRMRGVPRHRG